MFPQGGLPVKSRRVQQAPDLLQRQTHVPVEEYLLEPVHFPVPIEAVVVLPAPPGAEQTDGIIIAQGPGRQPREPGQFLYGIHPFTS